MNNLTLPENLEGKIIIYPSSPYGFSESGRYFMENEFIPAIQELGDSIYTLNPWNFTTEEEVEQIKQIEDPAVQLRGWSEFCTRTFYKNAQSIEICHLMVAVLDGLDVDPGVSWEVGYRMGLDKALGKKTPVIGYRSDFRLAGENLGTKINLQVGKAIEEYGYPIVKHLDQAADLIAAEVSKLKQSR